MGSMRTEESTMGSMMMGSIVKFGGIWEFSSQFSLGRMGMREGVWGGWGERVWGGWGVWGVCRLRSIRSMRRMGWGGEYK